MGNKWPLKSLFFFFFLFATPAFTVLVSQQFELTNNDRLVTRPGRLLIFQFDYFSLQLFLDQNLTSQLFIQLFLGQNLTSQLFDRSIIWQKSPIDYYINYLVKNQRPKKTLKSPMDPLRVK